MYSSVQAISFVDNSLLPTMAKRTASQASEGAVKEFPVIAVEDFDMDLFEVKERGKKADGMPVFVTSYNHHKLTLNLTTGKKWLQVKYRLERGMLDATLESSKESNTLKVTLAVNEQVAATVLKIEDAVKTKLLPKLMETDLHKEAKWYASVKEGLFAAKVVMDSKRTEHMTHFKVRPFQKDVVVVSGKEQLQPLLQDYAGFERAQAKVVVSADSVWVMPRKGTNAPMAGIFWKIHHFIVDLPEHVRWVVPDVFEDVDWDDKEE